LVHGVPATEAFVTLDDGRQLHLRDGPSPIAPNFLNPNQRGFR